MTDLNDAIPTLFTGHPDGVYRQLTPDRAKHIGQTISAKLGRADMWEEVADLLSHQRGFHFQKPWSVISCSIEEFLIGMSALGTPQEIQMVGAFKPAHDASVRTAHRDVDLPLHRDGIYTKAIADMQRGTYVEKPNVDIIGMYCVRENGHADECLTTVSEDGETEIAAVALKAGEALVMDNRLWHGRRGPVGDRLLIRFWTTLNK